MNDESCDCGGCEPLEPGTRVVITGHPLLGEPGHIVGLDEARVNYFNRLVYTVKAHGKTFPAMGEVLIKSPYQDEPLEDVVTTNEES